MKESEKIYAGLEDSEIVALYWARAEAAIHESDRKYGKYCYAIAYNILYSNEDAEECINDTWLKAWHAMPPEKPRHLSAFLGKITRNIALNRYTYEHADKRNRNLTEIYDEASEPFANTENMVDEVILRDVINRFLTALPMETRVLFLRRYWYMSSVKEIARDYGLPEGTVKSILSRTRKKFQHYLEKEGIEL